jgi:hypothetical protein
MKRIALLTMFAMWMPTGACMSPDGRTTDGDGDPAAEPGDLSADSSSEQAITSELADQIAEQPDESPALSNDAPRPPCASVRHTVGIFTQTVYVINRCSQTVSFVVHRVGPDSPCLHAAPGRIRSYTWLNGLNYQGTTFGCD